MNDNQKAKLIWAEAKGAQMCRNCNGSGERMHTTIVVRCDGSEISITGGATDAAPNWVPDDLPKSEYQAVIKLHFCGYCGGTGYLWPASIYFDLKGKA